MLRLLCSRTLSAPHSLPCSLIRSKKKIRKKTAVAITMKKMIAAIEKTLADVMTTAGRTNAAADLKGHSHAADKAAAKKQPVGLTRPVVF